MPTLCWWAVEWSDLAREPHARCTQICPVPTEVFSFSISFCTDTVDSAYAAIVVPESSAKQQCTVDVYIVYGRFVVVLVVQCMCWTSVRSGTGYQMDHHRYYSKSQIPEACSCLTLQKQWPCCIRPRTSWSFGATVGQISACKDRSVSADWACRCQTSSFHSCCQTRL